MLTASRFMTCLMMWYSSEIPFPPSMSLDTLAISSALPHEFLLINETISGVTLQPFESVQVARFLSWFLRTSSGPWGGQLGCKPATQWRFRSSCQPFSSASVEWPPAVSGTAFARGCTVVQRRGRIQLPLGRPTRFRTSRCSDTRMDP